MWARLAREKRAVITATFRLREEVRLAEPSKLEVEQ